MNDKGKNGNLSFGNAGLMPREEQLETAVKRKKISIGIPRRQKE